MILDWLAGVRVSRRPRANGSISGYRAKRRQSDCCRWVKSPTPARLGFSSRPAHQLAGRGSVARDQWEGSESPRRAPTWVASHVSGRECPSSSQSDRRPAWRTILDRNICPQHHGVYRHDGPRLSLVRLGYKVNHPRLTVGKLLMVCARGRPHDPNSRGHHHFAWRDLSAFPWSKSPSLSWRGPGTVR